MHNKVMKIVVCFRYGLYYHTSPTQIFILDRSINLKPVASFCICYIPILEIFFSKYNSLFIFFLRFSEDPRILPLAQADSEPAHVRSTIMSLFYCVGPPNLLTKELSARIPLWCRSTV